MATKQFAFIYDYTKPQTEAATEIFIYSVIK